jgi:CMP-N-acetylneuraminic acid synthetase
MEGIDSLAVIPAKNYSERLPGKNLLKLGGRRLIERAVDSSLESGVFDRILVSTDSQDIRNVAEAAGAWCPFLRDEHLTKNTAGVADVVIDVLGRLSTELGYDVETVAILLPTAPFRSSSSIIEAFEMYASTKPTPVFSVTESDHPPFWTWTETEPGSATLEPLFPVEEGLKRKRQELPKTYRVDGNIMIMSAAELVRTGSYAFPQIAFTITPPGEAIDIDTQSDFDYCRFVLAQTARSQ